MSVACGVCVSLSDSKNVNSLVGVAISASLLPPAVNTGLCLAVALIGPAVNSFPINVREEKKRIGEERIKPRRPLGGSEGRLVVCNSFARSARVTNDERTTNCVGT